MSFRCLLIGTISVGRKYNAPELYWNLPKFIANHKIAKTIVALQPFLSKFAKQSCGKIRHDNYEKEIL